ncbi:DUF4258 domain-containing protein [Jiella sonneratiae]|uniref:DUF4258 domain-containing protein n=1 Tax=Jiella sonneratiae TaxID=2816856 RepID=A0ABS3IY99_9HYPH|nr:DUF4258 domain-containing protein [Jiella sonneratiae]MBO0902389.1 DUF4258 domain-containing protein [Jiella sonneratiae]
MLGRGEVVFSGHALNEVESDGILVTPLLDAIDDWRVVEDYPEAFKGPSVLVKTFDVDGCPVHLLWGIPKGRDGPAVLITGYRPEPSRWSDDFLSRRRP